MKADFVPFYSRIFEMLHLQLVGQNMQLYPVSLLRSRQTETIEIARSWIQARRRHRKHNGRYPQ